MNDAPPPPLTDGELADRIVAAVRHGFALAATDMEFPDRVQAATVNAILAVVHPELDRLRAGNEVEQLRADLARLRACDCFPNPNDHADRCPIYQAAAPASEEW